jgi:hypothetical protein
MRHAAVTAGEVSENPPPGWISQGGKGAVENLGRIFNHLVNYFTEVGGGANKKFKNLS